MSDKESITDSSLNTNKAITLSLTTTDQLNITTKAKTKRPPFYMIGNSRMKAHPRLKPIDLLDELADSSKAGQFLIRAIKNRIGFDNDFSPIVKIEAKELMATHKQYLKTGYKELHARNLVKRVKRSHYMLNPNALIPKDYDEALAIWESID